MDRLQIWRETLGILRVHFVPSILIASQKNNSKKERKNSPIHIIEMVNLEYPFFDIIPIIFSQNIEYLLWDLKDLLQKI